MLRLGMTGIWIVVVLTTQVQAYSGGSGTPEDPYQIATYEDLVALGDTPSDYDKCFILMADIDCDSLVPGRETDASAMIAPCEFSYDGPGDLNFSYGNQAFTGRFDGNGHVIRNLNRYGKGSPGLFGLVGGGAWIGQLGLEAVDLEGTKVVGALAAVVQSSCIMDCYSTGHLEGTSQSLVGGLVGYIENSLILDCYSSCQIEGRLCTGGLIGEVESGLILGCSSNAVIDAHYWTGGLVGYNATGVVQGCYASGQITGDDCVGGLIGGQIVGAVRRCYSSAEVSGDEFVGGLIGIQGVDIDDDEGDPWPFIENCYSTGTVTGTESVGGLVGYNVYPSVISRCYSTGAVTGETTVGGLVGEEGYEGYIVDCFWDVQSSGMSTSPVGTGLTTALLQMQETFLNQGWDFVNETDNGELDIWQMPTDGGTPVLVSSTEDFSAVTYTGQGTVSDPYQIDTIEQLLAIQHNPLAHYQLEQDLNLSDTIYSQALIPWFGGSLNGQSHAISGLRIEGVGYLGLFGLLSPNSWIQSLTITGAQIQTGQVSVFMSSGSSGRGGSMSSTTEPLLLDLNYSQGMGALAGYSYADLFYCSSDIEIQGGSQTGGLVGVNQGRLVGCSSTVSIEEATHRVGGLVGINVGRVMSCSSTGSIEGSVILGGLVAENAGWVSDCYSEVNVVGQTRGCLVGNNVYGIIDRCYSQGDSLGPLVGTNEYTDSQSGDIWGFPQLGRVLAQGRIRHSFHIIEDDLWEESWGDYWGYPWGDRVLENDERLASQAQDVNMYLEEGWDFADEVTNGTSDYWVMGPNTPQLRILQEPYHGSLIGRGLPGDPLLIYSPLQLGRIWEQPYAHYQLQSDLDLSGMTWSQAVVPWFGGAFDGGGHCLDGLSIKGVHQLGLFGTLESSSCVYDLTLQAVDVNGVYSDPTDTATDDDSDIDWSYDDGSGSNDWPDWLGTGDDDDSDYGYDFGMVQDPGSSSGSDDSTYYWYFTPDDSSSFGGWTGGRVYSVGSRAITYPYDPTATQIVTPSTHYVGALAGLNQGLIHDISCTSVVYGNYIVGGLVGCNEQSMSRCQARATVQGAGSIGGLIGTNKGEVDRCLTQGSVRSEGSTGGLVGNHAEGTVIDCYSNARVAGQEYSVGGVVGYGYGDALVQRCYTAVPGLDLVGDNYQGDVEDCPRNVNDARELETLLNKGWDFVGMEVRGSGGSGRSRAVGVRGSGSDGIWVWVPGYYPRLAWEGIDPNQVYSGGQGTANDPYQIATVNDFCFLADHPGEWDWDKNYILTADLDLDGLVWSEAPIAPVEASGDYLWWDGFYGHFNGDTHVIRNLTIKGTGGLGLFGVVWGGGCISNLGLEDVDISGTGSDVGALAGKVCCQSQVTNCFSTGSVQGLDFVGGLIGEFGDQGVLNNSYSWAHVKGQYYVGGLAGETSEVQMYCYSTGPVEGSQQSSGGRGGRTSRSLPQVDPNARWQWDEGAFVPYSGTDTENSYSLEQMQDVNTYLAQSWDFMGETDHGLHDTWQMPAEGGFPVLTVFQANNPFTNVGSGTLDDPYIISTAEQLGAVRQRPNSYYRLDADLDLQGVTWHRAVVPEFRGSFDGQGHAIKNLTLVGWDYLGLFGYLYEEAEVQRLGIVDVNISGAMEWQCYSGRGGRSGRSSDSDDCSWVMEGGEVCGAIAGDNDGTIANCYATGVINALDDLGGLVGYGSGDLVNCYSAVVILSDYGDVKGMGGNSQGTVGCFWDTGVSGVLEDDGAIGLTTAEMQDINTYLNAGWDFVGETDNGTEDLWIMPEEPGYPVLR